jgi:hypothetical protein
VVWFSFTHRVIPRIRGLLTSGGDSLVVLARRVRGSGRL